MDDRKGQEVVWAEGIKTYRVMVEDAPVEKENVWQFTGRVLPTEDIPDGSVRNDIGKLVRCSVGKKNAGGAKRALVNDEGDGQVGKELLLRPGDELLMRCRITELHNTGNPGEFDYAKWLRRQGVSGMAFCYAGYWMNTGESDDMPLTVKALRARSYMVERSAKYLSDDDLASAWITWPACLCLSCWISEVVGAGCLDVGVLPDAASFPGRAVFGQ